MGSESTKQSNSAVVLRSSMVDIDRIKRVRDVLYVLGVAAGADPLPGDVVESVAILVGELLDEAALHDYPTAERSQEPPRPEAVQQ